MTPQERRFLTAVVGDDGAAALARAVDRAPALAAVLVPRAALAWVSIASRVGFEGDLPGAGGSTRLQKSEGGISGVLAGSAFDDEPAARVAARVALALGTKLGKAEAPPAALSRLGKSIDLLAKLRYLAQARSDTAKAEPPAKVAEPTPPGDALAPDAPSRAQQSTKSPKPLRMSERQLTKSCPTCGDAHHISGARLRTCMCWHDLSADIRLRKSEDGSYEVRLGAKFDDDARAAFVSDRS